MRKKEHLLTLTLMKRYVTHLKEEDVVATPKTSGTDTRTLLTVKLWDDNMDAAGKRPENIELTVLRDGTPIRRITLNAKNNWQHVFYMLPGSGTYTVEEAPVADYRVEYVPVAEGYVIINSCTGSGGETPGPQTAHVAVAKVWNDTDDAADKRPASVTVQLSEENGWASAFHDMPKDLQYTIWEPPVEGYTAA